MNSVIRVAIYLRVSTDGQVFSDGKRIEDGSLDVQKKRALDYIQSICAGLNKQYEIKATIEDAGKSAKDTNRVGFQELYRLVESKQIDWIITSELSRLNRDTLDYLLFKKHCAAHKVQILYVGSSFKEQDASTDMIETILASYAEYERKQTSIRLKRNIISRLKTDGKINGADEILGLHRCPHRVGHFIINEEEIIRLRKLFEIYLASSGQAETLKTAKLEKIWDAGDRELTVGRFKNILKNVEWRYSGKWYLDESDESTIIRLDHGALISEDLCHRLLIKREALGKKKIRCGIHNHVYLLSSILKSDTGERFSGQIGHGRSKDYRYYYNKTSKQRINASEIEKSIENRVIKYFKDSKVFQKIIESGLSNRDSKITDLKKEISKIRMDMNELCSQIDNLVLRIADPSLDSIVVKTIATKLSEFDVKKENLSKEIARKEAMIKGYESIQKLTNTQSKIEMYAKELKNLNRSQKRELMEAIFEKIEVMNSFCMKIHIKKDPYSGSLGLSLPNGCDSELSGGTSRT